MGYADYLCNEQWRRDFGEKVIRLMDVTEEEKGILMEKYQKPFWLRRLRYQVDTMENFWTLPYPRCCIFHSCDQCYELCCRTEHAVQSAGCQSELCNIPQKAERNVQFVSRKSRTTWISLDLQRTIKAINYEETCGGLVYAFENNVSFVQVSISFLPRPCWQNDHKAIDSLLTPAHLIPILANLQSGNSLVQEEWQH